MRRKARVDSNHGEIVYALRQCGCSVMDLSRVGVNCADLMVRFRGVIFLLEVKGPDGIVTDGQRDWLTEWGGRVVRNPTDALSAVGALPGRWVGGNAK